MQYEEKLLELIFDNDEDALFDWIRSHPELEQVDILREFKIIMQRLMADIGESEAVNEISAELEEKTNAFEEACLDVEVASLKYELVEQQRNKLVEEMEERIDGVKAYIRECVETNAPNAAEMRELAAQIIALEKESGMYDPTEWAWLEG
jgi:hypothetical protein